MTEITLVSNGITWRGVKSLSIRKSLDQVQHSFGIVTTDRFQEGLARWNVRGGSDIQLYIEGTLLFDGFVNNYTVDLAEKQHTVSVAGSSKPLDIVECGHEGPYFWKNTTYEQIIRDVLKPYGLPVKFSKPLKALPITGFRVAVNDRAFDIIRRIAEDNGLTVFSEIDGTVALGDGTDATGGTVLGRGDYISLSTEHKISRSNSQIIVKSQRNDYKTGHTPQQSEKVVSNESQSRYRPLVVLHTGDETEFADYANHRFAGDEKTAEIVVKSAFDKQGRLWDINQKVHLTEPFVDIDDELLIADYALNLDEGSGLTVTLGLRVPQTYAPGSTSTLFARRARRRSGGFFGEVLNGLFGGANG